MKRLLPAAAGLNGAPLHERPTGSGIAMRTYSEIRAEAGLFTLINTFRVASERQQDLINLLVTATEQVMRHRAGFVSANIHRGLDGRTVVNYAQWRSRDDFEAMRSDPAAQLHMGEAAALAEGFELLFFEVVHSESIG